jgi:hypothetical protein
MDLQQKSTKPKSIMDEADAVALGEQGQAVAPITAASIAKAVAANERSASPVVGEQSALNDLVRLLLSKEAREARKEELDIDREKSRQAQRTRNAREIDTKALLKQARCRHLKGGKSRSKVQKIDYAVYSFTFSDADMYIRCQICGMKWRKNDTKEYLSRTDLKGRVHKIANHTKIGWHEALEMADQSSNTGGSSEITQRVMTGDAGLNAGNITKVGSDGVPYTPQVVDLEGNAVADYQL